MPNWCQNIVTFEGSKEDIAELVKIFNLNAEPVDVVCEDILTGEKRVFKENPRIALDAIDPMPKSLHICDGGHVWAIREANTNVLEISLTNTAITKHRLLKEAAEIGLELLCELLTGDAYRELTSKPISFNLINAELFKLKEKGLIDFTLVDYTADAMNSPHIDIQNSDQSTKIQFFVNFVNFVSIVLSNIEKYGHPTWYEYCIQKYGTKWVNVSVDYKEITETTIRLEFDTAWSPPVGAIDLIQKKFPKVYIEHYFLEEGCDVYGFHKSSNEELDDYEIIDGEWSFDEVYQHFYGEPPSEEQEEE